jgi:hypothetical protein
MWSGLVIIVQSAFILTFAPAEENNDRETIAQMDFEYSQSQARMSFDTLKSMQSHGDDNASHTIHSRSVSLDRPVKSGEEVSLDDSGGSGSLPPTPTGHAGDHSGGHGGGGYVEMKEGEVVLKSSLSSKSKSGKLSPPGTPGNKHVKLNSKVFSKSHSKDEVISLKDTLPSESESSSSSSSSSSDSSGGSYDTTSLIKSPTSSISSSRTIQARTSSSSTSALSKDARKTVELLKELGLLTTSEISKIEMRLANKEKSVSLP